MGMSYLPTSHEESLMNEINMTPLIDVMLVLLMVLMLALPAVQQAMSLDLPQVAAQGQTSANQTVQVELDAQGNLFWNAAPISPLALQMQAQQAAQQDPPPVVRLSADRSLSYERVLQTLHVLQQAGLMKVDFLTHAP